ncbi:7080_t:CDS:2, partial [Dentiscutata erythropus]
LVEVDPVSKFKIVDEHGAIILLVETDDNRNVELVMTIKCKVEAHNSRLRSLYSYLSSNYPSSIHKCLIYLNLYSSYLFYNSSIVSPQYTLDFRLNRPNNSKAGLGQIQRTYIPTKYLPLPLMSFKDAINRQNTQREGAIKIEQEESEKALKNCS